MFAIVGDQGQVDGDGEGPLAPPECPGEMGGEGGVDPPFDPVDIDQLGIEGGGKGLLARGLVEASASLVDRGEPRGGGEEDRENDLAGDLADGAELEVRPAEVDGEAIHLSGCQGVGGLAHRTLREWSRQHKSFSERHLSSPPPGAPTIEFFGNY